MSALLAGTYTSCGVMTLFGFLLVFTAASVQKPPPPRAYGYAYAYVMACLMLIFISIMLVWPVVLLAMSFSSWKHGTIDP